MDETKKIAQQLEEEIKNEQELEIEKALHDEINPNLGATNQDGKKIALMVGVILIIFILSLGGFKLYNNLTSAEILNIDDLHTKNLAGELDGEEGYTYNGYSFIKVDGLWWTEIKRNGRLLKIPLHFGPKEVEHLELKGDLNPLFNQGKIVLIAINPNINQNKYYTLSLMELNNNVAQGINRQIASACTEENYICENRTIVNCENTQGMPVIELVVSDEENAIEFIDTCIKVSGSGENLTKAVNRLLYHWYGII